MPQQTYNIGYGTNDFFYDKQNTEILKTIPFNKESLLAWVQTYDTSITSAVDVFDPKLTAVVFLPDNKADFIDNYLRGNIVVNDLTNFSDYNSRNVDLSIDSKLLGSSYNNDISGTLVIGTTNTNMPSLQYNLENNLEKTSEKNSNIEYTTNSSYNLNPDISLNAVLNNPEIPYPEPNGSTSYISVNTANPRCKFQKGCTEKHWHYASCVKQTFVNSDGTTFCRCVCNGPKTLDNTEHQHCSPFNIGTDKLKADGSLDAAAFQASIASLINKISISFRQPAYPYSAPTGVSKMSWGYNNVNAFTDSDKNIRTLIYNYYYELNRNIQLRNKIMSNNSIDNTASQALLDANVKYKKEYLHLFNIFSGILFASGYIYVMYKSKPE